MESAIKAAFEEREDQDDKYFAEHQCDSVRVTLAFVLIHRFCLSGCDCAVCVCACVCVRVCQVETEKALEKKREDIEAGGNGHTLEETRKFISNHPIMFFWRYVQAELYLLPGKSLCEFISPCQGVNDSVNKTHTCAPHALQPCRRQDRGSL